MRSRWISWLFFAVMLYMIYAASASLHHQAPLSPAPDTSAPVVDAQTYPALAAATDVEAWKRKLNPDYAAAINCSNDAPKTDVTLGLKVMEEVAGDGAGATCGEAILLQLTVWNAASGKAYDGKLSLVLGAREVAAGLDVGLLGIKPGGVRTLVVPPALLRRRADTKVPAALLRALPAVKAPKMLVVTVKRI